MRPDSTPGLTSFSNRLDYAKVYFQNALYEKKIEHSLFEPLLIPHSHQNLSCLRSSVHYPRFIEDDSAEELLTPLLRQLNVWCECSIT